MSWGDVQLLTLACFQMVDKDMRLQALPFPANKLHFQLGLMK